MRNNKSRIFVGIDLQNDFCRGPNDKKYQGTLFVEGSEEDIQQTCHLLNNYGSYFDDLYFTLDSHHRWHIADGIMWINKHGEHPKPYTQITYDNVVNGTWMSSIPQYQKELEFYTSELKRLNKMSLMIWPTHCQISHEGSNLHPDMFAAMKKWEEDQRGVATKQTKGSNVLREHYGAFEAEIFDPNDPAGTGLNNRAIEMIVKYDEIVCGGEAENFCFENTMTQIVKLCEISNQTDKLKKLVFLTDAMSCVKIPGWEDHQKQFQTEMKTKGIRFMTVDQYIKTLK